jgi:hypothetical protein
MSKNKQELEYLLKILAERGFEPLGILFYDPKLKLLGIAPQEQVPDAWVEMIGKRLSGSEVPPGWMTIH